MIIEQRLRRAELSFLNAPFHPDGWHLAVGDLLEVVGGVGAQIVGLGGPAGWVDVAVHDIHDPHNHLSNPLVYGPSNFRIGSADGRSRLQHEPQFEAYRALHDTSLYDDVVSDLDTRFGCQATLLSDRSTLFGLALFRSQRQGACDADALDRFVALTVHAQRALRVQLALGRQAAELMLGGLKKRTDSTLLLDSFGSVAAMTPAAEALFDHPEGLRLEGMLVRLPERREDNAFQAALARLLAAEASDGPLLHQARVGRSAHRPEGRWELTLARLPATAHALTFEPRLAMTLRPIQPGRTFDRRTSEVTGQAAKNG